MTEKWKGSLVYIDCGDVLGTYEGEVSNVDSTNQLISLRNVKRNSVACQLPEVTLRSRDIKNLRIVKSAAKNVQRNNTVISQAPDSAFSQPVNTVQRVNDLSHVPEEHNKRRSEPLSISKNSSSKKKTPKKNDSRKWMSERDEACFSVPVDSNTFDEDFDFEKNLALFDKRAVFDEIDALSKSESGGVRLVDCNKRSQPKYKHDENVLLSETPVMKQITVPCVPHTEFVTDSGLIVPSVTKEFKDALFQKAEHLGMSLEVRIEMVGRAASEMVLQLLGGCHRLNPQNLHQKPTAVILCGPHIQGAQAINCGRHLANHQVNVAVLSLMAANSKAANSFSRELGLFSLTDGAIRLNIHDLPPSVDIIINAINSHDSKENPVHNSQQLAKIWVSQCKAPVLCLDPLPGSCPFNHKYVLSSALPFAFESDNCSVYICDAGLPKGVFTELGCQYASPFGSRFVIPVYTKS